MIGVTITVTFNEISFGVECSIVECKGETRGRLRCALSCDRINIKHHNTLQVLDCPENNAGF